MKWIGQHIWSLISRFRSDVYLESLSTTTETNVLVVDSAGKVSKSTSVSGDLTSIVAGTGLSGTSLTGPIPTLNVDASQTQITAVGIIGTGTWRATPITTAYIADDAITEDKLANTLLAEIDANTTKLSGIEDNATADQTQADINGLAITTVGTINSGTWQGTAIASNYLDSDTAHLSGIQTFIGPRTFAAGIIYDGDRSTTPGDGAAIHVDSSDITDNNTSVSGTATAFRHVSIENPRIMASNALVTTTTASTVYIKGAPVASTNQTITNAYALEVAAGNVKLGSNLEVAGDITVTGNDIKDSGGNSIISSNGSGVVTMAGGNISVGGTNANLEMNAGSDIILEADNAGGSGASSIQYKDSGGGNKIMLAANSDVVILSNRASNGTVQIRANTSTAGSGGEVTVATFEDDKVTISQDLDVAGTIRSGITYIKILPSDFIADDGGRPLAIDDTGSDRWLESHSTNPMFASVEIPAGFKATHVDIYGDGTSAVTVYEADINTRTVTSKGTGNIGTQINITDVTADATNYLLIAMLQASGEQVNGGKVTIAAV